MSSMSDFLIDTQDVDREALTHGLRRARQLARARTGKGSRYHNSTAVRDQLYAEAFRFWSLYASAPKIMLARLIGWDK